MIKSDLPSMEDHALLHRGNLYEEKTLSNEEGDIINLLWDFTIHTNCTVEANRPDIVIIDYKEYKCYLIDMIIASDKNVSAKEFYNFFKYKDLKKEITRIWHINTLIIPAVVLGILVNTLRKSHKNHFYLK